MKYLFLTSALLLTTPAIFAQINTSDLPSNIGQKIEIPEAEKFGGGTWKVSEDGGAEIIQFTHLGHEVGLSAIDATILTMDKREFDTTNLPYTIIALQSDEADISKKLDTEKLKGITIIPDADMSFTKNLLQGGSLQLPLNIVVDADCTVTYIDKGYKRGKEAAYIYALELTNAGNTEKLETLRTLMKAEPVSQSRSKHASMVGKKAPDLSEIEVVRGDGYNTEDKYQLVEFWATWCGPCKTVQPVLEKIHNENSDKVALISITYEDKDLVSRYLKKNPNTYTIGINPDRSILNAFEVVSFPSAFLINKEGVVIWADHPAQFMNDPKMLDRLIEEDMKKNTES